MGEYAWWDYKKIIKANERLNATGFKTKMYGVPKAPHERFADAMKKISRTPGTIIEMKSRALYSIPLITRDAKVDDYIFFTKDPKTIKAFHGHIAKIKNVDGRTFKAQPGCFGATECMGDFVRDTVYVVDPKFIEELGWEKSVNYDDNCCPTCGSQLSTLRFAPYCSQCNLVCVIDQYSGLPTDRWIEPF